MEFHGYTVGLGCLGLEIKHIFINVYILIK